MLQNSEVTQRLKQVEQVVHQVAEQCRNDDSLPSELKQCIEQLDMQVGQTQKSAIRSDPETIVQSVDELEATSDKAKALCNRGSGIPADIQSAIQQAHDELSSLKHEIH